MTSARSLDDSEHEHAEHAGTGHTQRGAEGGAADDVGQMVDAHVDAADGDDDCH